MFLGLGGVEGGIGRAGSAGVILERAALEFGIELGPAFGEELADLPAGKAFAAGNVVEAGQVAGGEFPDGARGSGHGNGAAKFIGEKGERFALLPGAADFLVEGTVASGRNAAVEGSADDHVMRMGQDNLLGGGLGFGIDAERMDGLGLDVIAVAAIEDEVGGKEHEREVRGEFGKMGGDFDVDTFGERRIFLADGGFADGGAVDDELRSKAVEGAAEGGGIGEVKLAATGGDDLKIGGTGGRGLDEVAADESTRAGDPDGAASHAISF